ncbi:hypothetical protein AV530_007524 [Patagioenas fasciata monilis]|uniref:Uncharacterized protein n=1 Tax=Patagioenas fasciata monilis TaxID=372326 RepID=A0A1V4JY26_PATFA|nr:hypothetical protein AV530_007524 [Patagioenas fasciata monilis]
MKSLPSSEVFDRKYCWKKDCKLPGFLVAISEISEVERQSRGCRWRFQTARVSGSPRSEAYPRPVYNYSHLASFKSKENVPLKY